MMGWFKKTPSPETIAVKEQTVKLEKVQEKRKSALARLMKALDDVPLDDALSGIGRDLNDAKRGGH